MQLECQWEDEFFKYIIDQKVASIGDINWDHILEEKPFLTKLKISMVLSDARRMVEVKGPLYEQIAAFRSRIPTGKSSPKWIEERKLEVNQIYDNMRKAKSK